MKVTTDYIPKHTLHKYKRGSCSMNVTVFVYFQGCCLLLCVPLAKWWEICNNCLQMKIKCNRKKQNNHCYTYLLSLLCMATSTHSTSHKIRQPD